MCTLLFVGLIIMSYLYIMAKIRIKNDAARIKYFQGEIQRTQSRAWYK